VIQSKLSKITISSNYSAFREVEEPPQDRRYDFNGPIQSSQVKKHENKKDMIEFLGMRDSELGINNSAFSEDSVGR